MTHTKETLWTPLVLAGLLISSSALAEKGDRAYGGVNYGPPTIANGMVRPASARQLSPVWVGTRHVRSLDGRGPVDRPGVRFKRPINTMAVTQVASKMCGGETPNRWVVQKAMDKLFGRSGLTSSQIAALASGKLNVYGARLITDPRVQTIPGARDKKGHAVYGALIQATAVTPWDTDGVSRRYVNLVLKSSRPDERSIIQRLAHNAEAQAVAIGQ